MKWHVLMTQQSFHIRVQPNPLPQSERKHGVDAFLAFLYACSGAIASERTTVFYSGLGIALLCVLYLSQVEETDAGVITLFMAPFFFGPMARAIAYNDYTLGFFFGLSAWLYGVMDFDFLRGMIHVLAAMACTYRYAPQYLTPVYMALGAVIVPISSLLKHECGLTNRYIERDPRSPHYLQPRNFQQPIIAYCTMQSVLGCLAVLDFELMVCRPIHYIRQIKAHLLAIPIRIGKGLFYHFYIPLVLPPENPVSKAYLSAEKLYRKSYLAENGLDIVIPGTQSCSDSMMQLLDCEAVTYTEIHPKG